MDNVKLILPEYKSQNKRETNFVICILNFYISLAILKNDLTAFVEARGFGRNAPEASAGFPLGHEEPRTFPQEEAGGVSPAPSAKKSAPYDSKRAAQAPGPWIPSTPTPNLFSKS
jgi:hypothetical protein